MTPIKNSGKCGISHPVTYLINRRSQLEAVLSVIFSDNVIPLSKEQCELCEWVSKIHRSHGHFARAVPKASNGTLERPLCCAFNRVLSIAVNEDHGASQYSHQRWWGAAAVIETPFLIFSWKSVTCFSKWCNNPRRLQNTCPITGNTTFLISVPVQEQILEVIIIVFISISISTASGRGNPSLHNQAKRGGLNFFLEELSYADSA